MKALRPVFLRYISKDACAEQEKTEVEERTIIILLIFFLRSVLCVDYHVISQGAYTFSVDCSRDPWKLTPPTTGFDLILSLQLRYFISSSLFCGIIRSTCSLAHETNTAAYWTCFHLSIQSEKLHTFDKGSSYMEHWQTIQLNKKGKERT